MIKAMLFTTLCVLWVVSKAANPSPGYQPPWVYTSRHPAINQWIRNNRETLRATRSSIGNFNVANENYKAFLVELTKDEKGVPRPDFVTLIIAKKTGNDSERRKVVDFERQWNKRLMRQTRTDEEIAEELKQEKEKRAEERKALGCRRLATRSQAFVCDDEDAPAVLRHKPNLGESTSTTTLSPELYESDLFSPEINRAYAIIKPIIQPQARVNHESTSTDHGSDLFSPEINRAYAIFKFLSPPQAKINYGSTSTTTTAPVTDHEPDLFVFDQDEPVGEPEESVCLDAVELLDEYVREECAVEVITEPNNFNDLDLSLLSSEQLNERSEQILNEISRRCRVLDEAATPEQRRLNELYGIPFETLRRKGGAKQTAEAKLALKLFLEGIDPFERRIKPNMKCISVEKNKQGKPVMYVNCKGSKTHLKDEDHLIKHVASHAVDVNQCWICLNKYTYDSGLSRHLNTDHVGAREEVKKKIKAWKKNWGKWCE